MNGRAQTARVGNFFLQGARLSLLLIITQPVPASAQFSTTDPLNFFTNLSSRLIQKELSLQLNQLQIHPTNQYSPAVHRLLQVAANLWETTQNPTNNLPTVFRPRFSVTNNAVYLSSFVLVTNHSELDGLPLLDLTANPPTHIPTDGDALIFGVPLVIGARKGLPNFNEFSFETLFTISRQVQLRKVNGAITETNQFFAMELTVPVAAEFWNSYATNYSRPITILATNYMTFTLSNDFGVHVTQSFTTGNSISTNDWISFNAFMTGGNSKSFLVPLWTNIVCLPAVTYLPDRGSAGFFPIGANLWDGSQQLNLPRWGVSITNRLHAMILTEPEGEILDYVLLDKLIYVTNFTDIIALTSYGNSNPFNRSWSSAPTACCLSGRPGVIAQINISLGLAGSPSEWSAYSLSTPHNVQAAIHMFRDFYYYSPTNGYASAPFTPTVQLRIQNSWQANDPLVNDLTGVLFDSERSGIVEYALPVSPANQARLYGIGQKNNHHKPWAIDPGASDNDPNAFNANLKDPRVRTSDEWHFPTNVVCQLDSLGQIHRGTPWQTIYLKSGIADANSWQHWSGHPPAIAALTHPTNDWTLAALMLDLFRTNSPHNLLSVNAPNQNDWLEIFNGMTALTNTSTFTVNLQPLTLISNAPQLAVIVSSLTATRASQPGQVFRQLGNVLATPELSLASPYLNRSSESLLTRSITDEAYERIPAQLLLRLRGDSIGSFEPGPPAILRFTGFDSTPYAVQVSSNLLNWISVSTNYPTNGIFEWRAPPTTTTREFYRSALLP